MVPNYVERLYNLGGLLCGPLGFPAVLGLIAQPLKQESEASSTEGLSAQPTCRY
jgi:hypothetical protein